MKQSIFLFALIAMTTTSIDAIEKPLLPQAKVSNQSRQSRPIKLGVSGGSVRDSANGYCCSGTLGSLVEDSSGTQYILSNTHVFAGDRKNAAAGDSINQPGYIDVKCRGISSDYVARLSDWQVLSPGGESHIDAAIAKVVPGKVNSKGEILNIGKISKKPIAATVGQKVKKSGRTSGLTTGKVASLHATVDVEYSEECGGKSYTVTLKDQIVITPGSFLKAGDSGSLMVENKTKNPRPVGLLFAGSSSAAIANPIQAVLDKFSVTMVGEEADEEEVEPEALAAINAAAVKEQNAALLMQVEGAIGHAVGLSKQNPGIYVIQLLVDKTTKNTLRQAPSQLGGIPVEIVEIGKIKAY